MRGVKLFFAALWTTPPRESLRRLANRFRRSPKGAPPQPTITFLRSAEYRDLMSHGLPPNGRYDRHEAQTLTVSFRHRHWDEAHRLGVFRWRGIQENLEGLLELLEDPAKLVVDLGGAGGPLGLGSLVVDKMDTDAWGRPVPYHLLRELPRRPDVIFSSHCLEHMEDLEGTLEEIAAVVESDGVVVLHLPAYTCLRWQTGQHESTDFGDHRWTFALSGDHHGAPADAVEIDNLASRYFDTVRAHYCGDDSIYVICSRSRLSSLHQSSSIQSSSI